RRALSGTPARVVTGTLHDAPGSYDAVLVTCSMNRIPAELAGFLAPGAAAVLPWSPDPQSHSTPVVAVRARGGRLTGDFVREGSFMRSRDQRPPAERFPGLGAAPDTVAAFEATSDEVIDSGAMTPLMLMLPGVRLGVGMRPFDGTPRRIVYLGAPDGSWAYLWPDGALTMGGPSAIADRVTVAFQLLTRVGFPGLTACRLGAAPGRGVYRVGAEGIGEWVHGPGRPASAGAALQAAQSPGGPGGSAARRAAPPPHQGAGGPGRLREGSIGRWGWSRRPRSGGADGEPRAERDDRGGTGPAPGSRGGGGRPGQPMCG